jgi:hypothetical protein
VASVLANFDFVSRTQDALKRSGFAGVVLVAVSSATRAILLPAR